MPYEVHNGPARSTPYSAGSKEDPTNNGRGITHWSNSLAPSPTAFEHYSSNGRTPFIIRPMQSHQTFGNPAGERKGVDGKNCPFCHMPNNPCLCDDREEGEMFPAPHTALSAEELQERREKFDTEWLPELNKLIQGLPYQNNPSAQAPPEDFLKPAFLAVYRFWWVARQLQRLDIVREDMYPQDDKSQRPGVPLWQIEFRNPYAAAKELAQHIEVSLEILDRAQRTGLPASAQVLSFPFHWIALEEDMQDDLLSILEKWRTAKVEGRWQHDEARKRKRMNEFERLQGEAVRLGPALWWWKQAELVVLERAERRWHGVDATPATFRHQRQVPATDQRPAKRRKQIHQDVTPAVPSNEQPEPAEARGPVAKRNRKHSGSGDPEDATSQRPPDEQPESAAATRPILRGLRGRRAQERHFRELGAFHRVASTSRQTPAAVARGARGRRAQGTQVPVPGADRGTAAVAANRPRRLTIRLRFNSSPRRGRLSLTLPTRPGRGGGSGGGNGS